MKAYRLLSLDRGQKKLNFSMNFLPPASVEKSVFCAAATRVPSLLNHTH